MGRPSTWCYGCCASRTPAQLGAQAHKGGHHCKVCAPERHGRLGLRRPHLKALNASTAHQQALGFVRKNENSERFRRSVFPFLYANSQVAARARNPLQQRPAKEAHQRRLEAREDTTDLVRIARGCPRGRAICSLPRGADRPREQTAAMCASCRFVSGKEAKAAREALRLAARGDGPGFVIRSVAGGVTVADANDLAAARVAKKPGADKAPVGRVYALTPMPGQGQRGPLERSRSLLN